MMVSESSPIDAARVSSRTGPPENLSYPQQLVVNLVKVHKVHLQPVGWQPAWLMNIWAVSITTRVRVSRLRVGYHNQIESGRCSDDL